MVRGCYGDGGILDLLRMNNITKKLTSLFFMGVHSGWDTMYFQFGNGLSTFICSTMNINVLEIVYLIYIMACYIVYLSSRRKT